MVEKIRLNSKEKKKIRGENNKRYGLVWSIILILFLILSLSFTSAGYVRTNNFNTLGGVGNLVGGFYGATPGQFDRSMCEAGQDFVLQIAPFGCEPAVVRSDLLEEQNVPIYCQISATQINPLIDVKAIQYINFKGETPREVAGIGFFPNQAALGNGRSTELENHPILENVGYAVIVLRQNDNESEMPDYVEGNLTAEIRYNIENAAGVGRASFYLPLMEDKEFEQKYSAYGFWDGRGYLKAEEISEEGATISVYSGRSNQGGMQVLNTVGLRKGQTSNPIYMTGFDYCLANMKLRLDDITYPTERASLRINGDYAEVAKDEEFLEGRCKVTSLTKNGFSQQVKIKCDEDENQGIFNTGFGGNTFNLVLSPTINLSINGVVGSYGLGDFLYQDPLDQKAVYLAYIGSKDGSGTEESLQILLIRTNEIKNFLDDDELEELALKLGPLYENSNFGSGVLSTFADAFKWLGASVYRVGRYAFTGDDIIKISYGEQYSSTKFVGILDIPAGVLTVPIPNILTSKTVGVLGFAGASNKKLSETSQEYYTKAIEDYDSVLSSFANENYKGSNLGEQALKSKIELAKDFEQKRTMLDFCKEFEQKYPDKYLTSDCEDVISLSNSGSSSRTVLINGKVKEISFRGVYSPGLEEYSVEGYITENRSGVMIPTQFTIGLNGRYYMNLSNNEYIELKQIRDQKNLLLYVSAEAGIISSGNVAFEKGVGKAVGNKYTIVVNEIKLKRVARVSVLPNINHASSNTTFQFKIGIEKRSDLMKLSPEEAKDKIDSLDSDIEKLEKISNTLGKTVKGLKTACLATGAFFTAENLLANMDGRGIARQKIMRDNGGWYDQCQDLLKRQPDKYSSVQDCLFENSDKIDADVEKYHSILTAQNKEIKEMQKIIEEGGFLSEDIINTTRLVGDYTNSVKRDLDALGINELEDPSISVKRSAINIQSSKEALSYPVWLTHKHYSFEELRDIGFYARALKQNPQDKIAHNKLYSLLYSLNENYKRYQKDGMVLERIKGKGLPSNINYDVYLDKSNEVREYNGAKQLNQYGDIVVGTPVYLITYNSVDYILGLEKTKGSTYVIKNIYDSNGHFSIDKNLNESIIQKYQAFKEIISSSYRNKYENPEVKYYESGNYRGYPALVPLDLEEGWYVAIKPTLPVFGNIASFDKSGRVHSYILGNVGENGRVDYFGGIGDDITQTVLLDQKESFTIFHGLSKDKVSDLINKINNVLPQVQKQYSEGIKQVSITGVGPIDVGTPASEVPEMECEDFMSPSQCQLLFNVCDPVICPSSRCDLGGAYPVTDVIQTGVIGSLALCLPNAAEGIYVPICLTGVQAGIDNWVSIQKSYQSCLQEQLETGKTVGICDEIQSIYACEFFWRQSLPVANVIVPSVLSNLFGQNTRGGGEYLGVLDAWNNAEKSVDFFTKVYGENSFTAFKARSTDQIGGAVCKSFVSGVFPSNGDFFDSLTEPDSPVQFTGRFDEIPITTITNPPVSHYKVFYHIYAGKDQGAYYRIYLRGVPGSSYYQDTAIDRVVDYGYVEKGGVASETVDFTATSGYEKLCILVNGQEECGFKEVSTNFAVNYLKESYLSNQANTPVRSEQECISGTPSLYNLLNPNLQEGVGDLVNPELYKKGIIRICATDNPGVGTDPNYANEDARWIEVGNCGNSQIKCWLDQQSVKDVIKNQYIENDTLDNLRAQQEKLLQDKGESLNLEDVLKEINYKTDNQEKITAINSFLDKFFFNFQKGKLILERGNVYKAIGLLALKEQKDKEANAPDVQPSSTPSEAPQVLKLPISVRLVAYTMFGDTAIGDILSQDPIYSWDGNKWQGGKAGAPGVLGIENAKSTNWKDGLDFMAERALGLNKSSALSKIEVECNGKTIEVFNKLNLPITGI